MKDLVDNQIIYKIWVSYHQSRSLQLHTEPFLLGLKHVISDFLRGRLIWLCEFLSQMSVTKNECGKELIWWTNYGVQYVKQN